MIELSQSPEDHWLDHLSKIKQLSLKDKEISQTRDMCVSAYETFGEAILQLQAAKAHVKKVEKQLQLEATVSKTELEQIHKKATFSTIEVAKTLDKAEVLVNKCNKQRNLLRKKLNR